MPSSHSLEKSRRQVELVIRRQTRWSGEAPHPPPPPYPPPPPKKKIQAFILVTPQKYILNAQGAYNHSAGVQTELSIRSGYQEFPMATKSMTPVYLHKERKGEGKDIPSCSIFRLLIVIYTRQLEITAAALNIHIFFTSITHKFVWLCYKG